jgi:hypothetical protein
MGRGWMDGPAMAGCLAWRRIVAAHPRCQRPQAGKTVAIGTSAANLSPPLRG